MSVLSKAEIFSMDDLPKRTVRVPEWGGEVILQAFGGAERDIWDRTLANRQEKARKQLKRGDDDPLFASEIPNEELGAIAVALAVVDEEGNKLFTLDEVEALNKKNGQVITRLSAVICALSGIGEARFEEAMGNSPASQDSSTGSGSQKDLESPLENCKEE